ncbi:hypothetical protein [Dongshaea marina]|uniref:hypothetical protein n=1 Tax=Dongshaea marina TaxID=2047966 RepID=UPI000D3E33A8|nr:hypothetical protein [Dongshaea marina]
MSVIISNEIKQKINQAQIQLGEKFIQQGRTIPELSSEQGYQPTEEQLRMMVMIKLFSEQAQQS